MLLVALRAFLLLLRNCVFFFIKNSVLLCIFELPWLRIQLSNCLGSFWHNSKADYLLGRATNQRDCRLRARTRGAQAESGPQQGVAPGQRRTCMAHGQWPRPKVEVEAHAPRVLCILMPRRHRHLELLNLGHGPATGTGSQTASIRVEPVERCLCWCYFHCKQMMRNTQTHSNPKLAICGTHRKKEGKRQTQTSWNWNHNKLQSMPQGDSVTAA